MTFRSPSTWGMASGPSGACFRMYWRCRAIKARTHGFFASSGTAWRKTLIGASILGKFENANGITVPILGTISGNTCSVTMDQSCYAVPGRLRCVFTLTTPTVGPVPLADITISVSDPVGPDTSDPLDIVPDLAELLAMIETLNDASESAVEAAQNANDAADAAYSATFRVLGIKATAEQLRAEHPQGEAGNAFAVGTATSNEIYIWDVDLEDWRSIGNIPIVFTETDPTVPGWAKQPAKPSYTPQEVGAVTLTYDAQVYYGLTEDINKWAVLAEFTSPITTGFNGQITEYFMMAWRTTSGITSNMALFTATVRNNGNGTYAAGINLRTPILPNFALALFVYNDSGTLRTKLCIKADGAPYTINCKSLGYVINGIMNRSMAGVSSLLPSAPSGDQVNAVPLNASGSGSVTANASAIGTATISYGKTYAVAPMVFIQPKDALSGAPAGWLYVSARTTTQFTVSFDNKHTSARTQAFDWMAFSLD